VFQLSFGSEYYVEQLWDLQVSSLGFGQYFVDEVNMPLYFECVALVCPLHDERCADHLGGSDTIMEESFTYGGHD
jgi:hypothetical protein